MIRNMRRAVGEGVPRATSLCSTWRNTTRDEGQGMHEPLWRSGNLHIVSPISMPGRFDSGDDGRGDGRALLGHKIVAMTWIGDGGSSTGVFHEGLNFARHRRRRSCSCWKNNLWAYSTPVKGNAGGNLADRAKAYGVKSFVVDAMMCRRLHDAKEAVDLRAPATVRF